MKKQITLVLCTLSLMAVTAQAQQNCDKPRDDFDDLYCLNKVYLETDADLNKSYGELVERLDTPGKAALKRSQLAWIKERNGRCSRKEEDGFLVNLSCATRKTRQRLEFLQERVRECRSSGCQPSRL